MSDQECKVRPAVMNISSNVPLFYPYSVLENKCSVTVIICQELMKRIIDYGMKLVNVKGRLYTSVCNDKQH